MPKLPVIMNKKPNLRQTAQEMKQHFIESAEPLVQQYLDAALGVSDFTSVNAGAREECWDVIKKLMLQSSDKLEINIESAEDVIDAVSKGDCTFEEGEKLLSLYKKVKEIDTMGNIGVNGAGGLTINILNAEVESPKPIDAIPAVKVLT